MKILLYNDNPVVRKLVALSAQKTKDDLNVIWSVDELDNESYDLLIVDDALYTDDVMAELKARVPFKTTLMMATRGSSVPAGFDNVIHKPFLPTDLVDLFSHIDKSLNTTFEEPAVKQQVNAINLEDEIDELSDTIAIDDLPDLGDFEDDEPISGIKTNILDQDEVQEVQNLLDDEEAFSLDEESLEGIEETLDTSLIDDIDEVLDDIEEDGSETAASFEEAAVSGEDDIQGFDDIASDDFADGLDDSFLDDLSTESTSQLVQSSKESGDDVIAEEEMLEDLVLPDEPMAETEDLLDETEDLDALMSEFETNVEESAPAIGEAEEDLDALMAAMADETDVNVTEAHAHIPEMDEDDLSLEDDLLEEPEVAEMEESVEEPSFEEDQLSLEDDVINAAELSTADDLVDEEAILDEDEMDELHQQIQEAVSDLELDDLDMELDSSELDALGIEEFGELDGLAGLEDIGEREMKLAVGEEVEDEPEITIGKGDHASLSAEALSEALGNDEPVSVHEEETISSEPAASAAEGVEALQVLLKTLSNEEVVKSLKGLNISININFGNNS